jgi:transcriptional regulator with XRE-family HTH domain
MRTEKFLDAVMTEKGFSQDRELAAWLKVTPPAISQYRKGVRTMDNEKCVAIALELGIDPLQVIMATDMDKAERAGQHSLWEVFSRRSSLAAAALLFLLVNLFLTPATAEAAPANAVTSATHPYSLYYVKCCYQTKSAGKCLRLLKQNCTYF